MSVVSDNLRRTSINIGNISKSISSSRKNVSSVGDSVNNISRIVSRNTKVKNELFQKSITLDSRRRELSKRKEFEDRIEANKVSTSQLRGLSFANNTGKGPLGRLISFLGFLTAGWIVENLPTWTFIGTEFISRIKKVTGMMDNFVDSLSNIFLSFRNLLSNSFNAIVRLDFNEFTEGNVLRSFQELNANISDLGADIYKAFSVFSTPLSQNIDTGEQAPGLGDIRTDTLYPPIQQEGVKPPSGKEVSGGVVNPQAVYSYLRELGVPHNHSLGILANIQGESGFRVGVSEPGGSGIGLFQYSYPSRKSAFLRAVPDYKSNWRGQVKFAIGESTGPQYMRTNFSTPEEAASWWMRKWERPDTRLYSSRDKEHNQFIKSFKPPSSGIQTTPRPSTPQQPRQSKPKIDPKKLGLRIGDRAGYLASRGREHRGRDITADAGTPLYPITDALITSSGWFDGYGYVVTYVDANGIEHMYGHMKDPSKYKKGDRVTSGTIIGYVGSTGRSTGPHLHWEISPKVGEVGYARAKIIDPLEYGYSASLPFTSGGTSPSISPAKIAPAPQVKKQSIPNSQRKGPTVAIIDDRKPQQQTQIYQSDPIQKPQGSNVDEFNLLNNFIKNKLLLDLAYL